MTDLAKKKEEAKKEIRSLLLSSPVGLTLQELQRDYKEYLGRQLPGKELGYNSQEEFINDLPDTVQVSWNGGVMILTGVSNSSTKHIQRLVSNQKVDSKKKWGVLGRRGRRGGPFFMQSPPRRAEFPRGGGRMNMQNYNPPRHQQARHRTVPVVNAYNRSQIQVLLANFPDGLPLTHICRIFSTHFHFPLQPRAMGFSSELDMMASLSDIVTLKQLPGNEMWVMAKNGPQAEQQGLLSHNNPGQHVYNGPVPVPAKVDSKPSLLKTPPPSKDLAHLSSPSSALKEEKPPPDHTGSIVDECGDHADAEKCQNIPVVVQNHIRQIMLKRPKGIFASRLPFEYKDMFQRELPAKTYGYNSVIEFVSDLSHIVRIERPHPQGDWHLLPVDGDAGNVKPTQADAVPIVRALFQEVEPDVKDSIIQVLNMHPNGVPLDKFLDTFTEMTGEILKIERYGEGDLKLFLHSLCDIVYISLDPSDRPIVCSKVAVIQRKFDRLKEKYQPMVIQVQEPPDSGSHLPEDAVSPGCGYRPEAIPPPPRVGSHFIQLFVSNVISPGVLWVQIRGKKHTVALEDLMDELDAVYHSKRLPKDFAMTPKLAQIGMVCAVIFPEDGFWHRAIITGVKDQLYEVYYVDYGNTCCVSIDNMKLLKTKFLKLPAQAIRARLSCIQPIDGTWKVNSRDQLLALCREKPLVGLVTAFKDRVLSLCLTDTSGAEDIHINDVLVSQGYALFVPDSDTTLTESHSQAPSLGLLYGEEEQSMSMESTSSEPCRRYVREAQVNDDTILNLIHIEGQLFLTSAEISALFFQEDILASKLRRDGVDIPRLMVSRDKHPDLFQELLTNQSRGVTKSSTLLMLFSFKGMPLMLELYGSPDQSEELKPTILEIIQWFDPDDPYWKGEESLESASEGGQEDARTCSSEDANDLPTLEDLQLVMNTLDIKRKRILNKMLLPDGCSTESVNELNDVEVHIKGIAVLMNKIELNVNADTHSQKSCGKAAEHTAVSADSEKSVSPIEDKAMHRVNPMMQKPTPVVSTANKLDFPDTVPEATKALPPPSQDLSALLQQQLLMNKLMMERLGLTQQATLPPQGMHLLQRQQQILQQHRQQLQLQAQQQGAPPVSAAQLGQGYPLAAQIPKMSVPIATPTPYTQAPNLNMLSSLFPNGRVGRGLPQNMYASLGQQQGEANLLAQLMHQSQFLQGNYLSSGPVPAESMARLGIVPSIPAKVPVTPQENLARSQLASTLANRKRETASETATTQWGPAHPNNQRQQQEQ